MADFEFSAMNLKGLVEELEARGVREQIVSTLSSEAQAACADPMSRRWYPSSIGVELWSAIVKHGGEPFFEDVNHEMARKSFGKVVGPLVKVALTLSNSSPAAVFSRLGQIASLALRNVQFEWKANDASSGVVTLTYPRAMEREIVEPAWRGIFRVGAELTGTAIEVERCVARPDANAFDFHVRW